MLYYHWVLDISWSVIFSTREMSIAVLDVDGCKHVLVEQLLLLRLSRRISALLWLRRYTCFTDLSRTTCALGRTVNTKYKTRQLISFARFTRRTQVWGEPKPWLIWKVVPTKQPPRCEANYQRVIYYSIALTGAQFTTAVTNKISQYTTSSPGRISLALAPPPKPRKSALGTRLVSIKYGLRTALVKTVLIGSR